jgi:nucleoside-diphosphate-sugar epimerase
MSATSEKPVKERQILLVGPYGVLGTGVVDAVAENRQWGIITAARRPVPTYRAQAAPPHVSVDLMDREGTTKAFSPLDKVTDLVFAAYVEKPTMAETVEPNARMLKNTLDALAARSVPLQRIVLAGGAKSYGFSLGAFNAPAKETDPRLIAPIHYHQQEDIVAEWAAKNGASWTVLSPSGHGTKPKLADEPGYRSRDLRCHESRTRVALTLSWQQRGMEHSPGDDGRGIIRSRDFVGSGRRQSTQSNLQRIERRCVSLAATVEGARRLLRSSHRRAACDVYCF